MPNWCQNTLVLSHSDPAMIKRAEDAFARGEFCQEFDPIPAELGETTSPNRTNAAEMLEKYGYTDWYSYAVNEWGTKWDFGQSDGINDVTEDELVVFFESAWSPPLQLMAKLEKLGFGVDLMYYEPGMGFCGHYTTEDGDECYETAGMTADQADEELPADLNEAFCIAESIRENEEYDE